MARRRSGRKAKRQSRNKNAKIPGTKAVNLTFQKYRPRTMRRWSRRRAHAFLALILSDFSKKTNGKKRAMFIRSDSPLVRSVAHQYMKPNVTIQTISEFMKDAPSVPGKYETWLGVRGTRLNSDA